MHVFSSQVTNRLLKMGYINSNKYGTRVQHYTKSDGDISYFITYKDLEGKLKRYKIGDKSQGITEIYCFQKRNEVVAKLRLGEALPIKHRKKHIFSFADAFSYYIEWAKVNKKTWKHNDLSVFERHLKDNIGEQELVSLKSKDFEELKQQKLSEGYSPKTVQHILGTARHIINYAIKNEYVKNYTNPIANGSVRMPKVDNAKLGFLSRGQADILLETLRQRKEPMVYRLTILLLHTGARFSEVASLTWNDVNLNNRLIFFKATKDGNPRHIYASDAVMEILYQLRQEAKTKLVIPSSNGKQIEQMPKQFQEIVDELIPDNKEAGKYRITTHSLRHTHASWLALSGAGILQIKDQLGHKKIDMTMRYAHLIPDERHSKTKEVFN